MLKEKIPHKLKITAYIIVASFFWSVQTVCAQSKIIYFKASKGYTVSNITGKSTTPLDTDDAVLFDVTNEQIIIVSETAQLYKIGHEELKRSDAGNSYIEYTVSGADGKKATILYLQVLEKTPTVTNRVMINDYEYPVTVLDGTVRRVF